MEPVDNFFRFPVIAATGFYFCLLLIKPIPTKKGHFSKLGRPVMMLSCTFLRKMEMAKGGDVIGI